MAERVTPFGASENGAGRAEENRRRSPVSIPAASPKAALHAFTAEGGGSFAAPTGHALSADVSSEVISLGFKTANFKRVLPLNFISAFMAAPSLRIEIEAAMLKAFAVQTKLSGTTVLVLDLSGSMGSMLSRKSMFTRKDTAIALAILANSICEKVIVYGTAGSDFRRMHETVEIKVDKGFSLLDEVNNVGDRLGGGGIFTRQALDFIKSDLPKDVDVDRIIVFSDSQDCDLRKIKPTPFGKYNYIVDVSSHTHGIAYDGIWTAEISGWSEHFMDYILGIESALIPN